MSARVLILLALLALCLPRAYRAAIIPSRRRLRHRALHAAPKLADPRSEALISQCTLHWRDTRLDHFSFVNTSTFKQRYFVCDRFWKAGGAVYFYFGNEADVLLYLNNTGLMWELAPRYDALLVFAEHRYYGQSKPFPAGDLRHNMGYLTTEQAMADYAGLIFELRRELQDPEVPVIGFGGSYGGMLATWFRIKYPHLINGAIAGSAPIWTFFGEDPPTDPGGFAAAVTWDASPEGGSAAACVPNARAAWKLMFEWAATSEGRAKIASAMGLCGDLETAADVSDVVDWASDAWSYLAMGDYPYASTYILNGEGELPAYPVRVACEHLSEPDLQGEELLSRMAAAVGLFYNASGSAPCFDLGAGASNATAEDADFWGFQFCSEQFMPQTTDGQRDMFWKKDFDEKEESAACEREWGVTPARFKATIEWGGQRIREASNIVFSNGGRDPWRYGGVLQSLSKSLVAVAIPEGAHHLDLMFSHDKDPQSVIDARKVEEKHIKRWIKEARKGGDGGRGVVGANVDVLKRGSQVLPKYFSSA